MRMCIESGGSAKCRMPAACEAAWGRSTCRRTPQHSKAAARRPSGRPAAALVRP